MLLVPSGHLLVYIIEPAKMLLTDDGTSVGRPRNAFQDKTITFGNAFTSVRWRQSAQHVHHIRVNKPVYNFIFGTSIKTLLSIPWVTFCSNTKIICPVTVNNSGCLFMWLIERTVRLFQRECVGHCCCLLKPCESMTQLSCSQKQCWWKQHQLAKAFFCVALSEYNIHSLFLEMINLSVCIRLPVTKVQV